MAGLDGIENKIEPPAIVSGNIFTMTKEQRDELHMESLPETLLDAVTELEKDDFMKDVLGSFIAEKYIAAKKDEWNRYRAQVTDWELKEYLYKF